MRSVCEHTHTRVHFTPARTHASMYMHTCAYTQHMCKNACVYHMCTQTHVGTHLHAHTCLHVHPHACTHITHMYTPGRVRRRGRNRLSCDISVELTMSLDPAAAPPGSGENVTPTGTYTGGRFCGKWTKYGMYGTCDIGGMGCVFSPPQGDSCM